MNKNVHANCYYKKITSWKVRVKFLRLPCAVSKIKAHKSCPQVSTRIQHEAIRTWTKGCFPLGSLYSGMDKCVSANSECHT